MSDALQQAANAAIQAENRRQWLAMDATWEDALQAAALAYQAGAYERSVELLKHADALSQYQHGCFLHLRLRIQQEAVASRPREPLDEWPGEETDEELLDALKAMD